MAVEYKGLGRRKSSVAKVKLIPGTGKISINGKKPETYFPNSLVIQDMEQPLVLTDTKKSYDVFVKVEGGGFTGQAGAIRLGIARALLIANPDFRKTLKSQKLLTRDSRVKERKKYGLYGARRSPQFTKR
ncbi:30S ribosomal protein S9 [Malacoplasma iowae]|uniref:Small ribosomal subunit protein uS9 n=2 Tax=Malacoplasma iowae TaxID=2116 RepID=A0A084U4C1_MALIO|nr:30S ribosomal protein S9 [Malacoplasma iowae]VEU62343.1 30S ribosomal protein S9 [Mycoplasmopsis fermentans]EGZ31540.1 30S ribosomal protein S9 [Malacoplasma iowae 695]KFB07807.1 ribosomal protein S9 [Malacoplasma iowae DK-CPA]QHG89831.1 30S ribosomal protein S9 [Malacoplasma iowae 695]WPL35359.1 30S ribosomal protein S9 [Malacoplasma iowae]